jgi:hypothetical protein
VNGQGLRRRRVQVDLLIPFVAGWEGTFDVYDESKRLKELAGRFLEEHDFIGWLLEADSDERGYVDGEDYEVRVFFEG